ncbi:MULTISPECIES: hypothetical protein [Burkholderia]|nr:MULTISPECIES: hypothetical protein [Burkholderia]
MKKQEASAALISALASASTLVHDVQPSGITFSSRIQRFHQQLDAIEGLNSRPNVSASTGEKMSAPGITRLPLDNLFFPIEAIELEGKAFKWIACLIPTVVRKRKPTRSRLICVCPDLFDRRGADLSRHLRVVSEFIFSFSP